MAMRKSSGVKLAAIAILAALCALIWYAVYTAHPGQLAVSFLAGGQGDAVFIRAPSGRSILVDGGPDAGVIRALGQVMPWYAHSIDLIVATSPAQAHSGGLPDVLSRYSIELFLQSSTGGSGQWFGLEKTLQQKALAKEITVGAPKRGNVIELGEGAYLQVLFPDRELPEVAPADGCIVMRLVYGTTSFLFPCDASQQLEKYLVMLDRSKLKSDVLLVGSNGSAKSSSPLFIGYVSPRYAVISHACDAKSAAASSTLATLQKLGVAIADTCVGGTVTFTSDGTAINVR